MTSSVFQFTRDIAASLRLHICKTVYFCLKVTASPRSAPYGHRIRPNHPSVMQRAADSRLCAQLSDDGHRTRWPYVRVRSSWIPHGEGARQGRIYPWQQMGRRRRRKPSSWESPSGCLLLLEWLTDVCRCLISNCGTLYLIDDFYVDGSELNLSSLQVVMSRDAGAELQTVRSI